MGSIVISDVVSHFPPTGMFAGNAQSPAPREYTPSQHSQQTTATPQARVPAPADTHMSDAGSRPTAAEHSSTAAHTLRIPGQTSAPPVTGSASAQPSQPPPSPRPKPTSQAPAPQHLQSGQQRAVPPAQSSATPVQTPQSSRVPSQPAAASPNRIKVKSLSHIQSFAADESGPFSQRRALSSRSSADFKDSAPQYEISEMPITDIIEMVAGLLTKITHTNDRQHEHLHRNIPPPEGASGLSQTTSSVLAFHGKNIPTISILSYLSRIHKYCPTTYEVFLSLLVYFDRMTERVNAGPMRNLKQANQMSMEHAASGTPSGRQSSVSSATSHGSVAVNAQSQAATPPPSGSLGKPPEARTPVPQQPQEPPSPLMPIDPSIELDPYNFSQFFVVDSFNIHRLVIAGVTCASKFFSDIFYTNSRYAKVGGLPLPELNHLEVQFLLLNDFRLSVPLEEMEAYGTMLVEFYAREVLAQQTQHGLGPDRSQPVAAVS